jgi:hypothetical protein
MLGVCKRRRNSSAFFRLRPSSTPLSLADVVTLIWKQEGGLLEGEGDTDREGICRAQKGLQGRSHHGDDLTYGESKDDVLLPLLQPYADAHAAKEGTRVGSRRR